MSREERAKKRKKILERVKKLIKKKDRRVENCLNCDNPLEKDHNFCSKCGQENKNSNLSFGLVVGDFFNNYFSFDSKLPRSIIPFFIKPGFLTKEYNCGKRVSYVHPIRLYLVISLFYFFSLSYYTQNSITELKASQDTMQGDNLASIFDNIESPDSLASDSSALDSIQLGETTLILNRDSLKKDIDTVGVALDSNSFQINEDQIQLAISLSRDKNISEAKIIDSLKLDSAHPMLIQGVTQSVRIIRGQYELFIGSILKNLPLMMFLMLPIFALLLKLLYIRKKSLYIQHLIHTLHLHSFAFLFYGILWIILDNYDEEWNWLVPLTVATVSIYAYISMLKVYEQSWIKTFFKFYFLGNVYFFLLSLMLLGEIIFSFLFF